MMTDYYLMNVNSNPIWGIIFKNNFIQLVFQMRIRDYSVQASAYLIKK